MEDRLNSSDPIARFWEGSKEQFELVLEAFVCIFFICFPCVSVSVFIEFLCVFHPFICFFVFYIFLLFMGMKGYPGATTHFSLRIKSTWDHIVSTIDRNLW